MPNQKNYKTLSIIISAFNEEATIEELFKRVKNANTLGLKKEIIIVDDGSVDDTLKILKKLPKKNLKLVFHSKNKGKGAGVRSGIKASTGDIILIQDADLEYHPNQYPKLLRPFLKKNAKVVYGSRELSGKNRHSSAVFHLGGRMVTTLTNLLYGSSLTDVSTCYKVFDSKLIKKIPLRCVRFEFCPEVTAHILKRDIDIVEVPITYSPRSYMEGKKIKAKDGVEAFYTLVRVQLGI